MVFGTSRWEKRRRLYLPILISNLVIYIKRVRDAEEEPLHLSSFERCRLNLERSNMAVIWLLLNVVVVQFTSRSISFRRRYRMNPRLINLPEEVVIKRIAFNLSEELQRQFTARTDIS